MENLAGRKDCDTVIIRELERAKITRWPEAMNAISPWPAGVARGEVPYTITGRIGPFVLERAWYYWMVKGSIPLAMAEELYADPAGKTDIRVNGHCGCPPPSEWVIWKDSDMQIIRPSEELETLKRMERHGRGDFVERFKEGKTFSDDPSRRASGWIDGYHIDSELGLRLFADAVRKYFPEEVSDA